MPDISPEQASLIEAYAKNPDLLATRAKKKLYERRLVDFMEAYWSVLHPGQGPMRRGWAIDAICDHLEGVSMGHIQYLLIDVPPGFSKSMATNVFFPAWEWGPRNMPYLQYLSAAYTDSLTQRDNERARTLMGSAEYVVNWGDRFCFGKEDELEARGGTKVTRDSKATKVDGRVKFQNNWRGSKEATSVKGLSTGGRADRLICDDPHSVMTAESDAIRGETLKWYGDAWSNRTNNERAAFIVIMQRVHEQDIAAMCIELGYTHLCIPMMFEWDHPHRWFGGGYIAHEPVRKEIEKIEAAAIEVGTQVSRQEALDAFLLREDSDDIIAKMGWSSDNDSCQTSYAPQYGKGDVRTVDDELAFPELFGPKRVKKMVQAMKKTDPTYAIAGQLQQRPVPRGGGSVTNENIRYVDWDEVPKGSTHIEAGGDLAGSEGKQSPYTVLTYGKYGVDGVLYLLWREKDRVDVGKLDDYLLELMERSEDMFGAQVRFYLPQDPGSAGKYQKAAMAKKFAGHWFKFSTEKKKKEDRAKPVISQFGANNVRIVRDTTVPWRGKEWWQPWNKDYTTNIKKFPAGRYKDDMDATSRMDMGLTEGVPKQAGRLTRQFVLRNGSERMDEETYANDDLYGNS